MEKITTTKSSNGNLRIAIQKNGRLTEETLDLLNTAGLEIDRYKQKLFSVCRSFPLEIIYVRDDDIPNYVQEGTADLGIIGQDLLIENKSRVEQVLPLGFGTCSLKIGVPKESAINRVEELKGTKIATSYPAATQEFFDKRSIPVETVTISGSVEIAPTIGVADAIADIASSGASMKMNDLRPIETIFDSQAVLIANPKTLLDKAKKEIIDLLLTRLKAVLAADRYKYVMMNLPISALERISDLIPGLKSPTVVPLADKDWVAVHSVIKEEIFWEVVESLKAAGAQGILVTPIEKLII